MDDSWDLSVRIIIIGDSAVGKSCLLMRFADDAFDESHINTIGVDFRIRTIKCDDKSVKLQTWDTAGQDRFLSITTSYYRGSQGVFIVYDVTNEESFENVMKWMSEVQKYAREDAIIILVGNKCDLNHKRKISYQQGKALADRLGISFLETSAKTSTNVDQVFQEMAQQIVSNVPEFKKKSQTFGNLSTLQLNNTQKTNCGCNLI